MCGKESEPGLQLVEKLATPWHTWSKIIKRYLEEKIFPCSHLIRQLTTDNNFPARPLAHS